MNKRDEEALLERVAMLLEDPSHAGHPLQDALQALYRQYRAQQEQLERLISISDRYQQLALEARQVTQKRYERVLRRQQKLSRISDGYQAMMRERNQALRQASTHDPLTQLANRRLIDERLREHDATRRGYTLVLLDIDHFKTINDRHGHDVGDRLLVAIAATMREELRDYDLCGRWGGEEFVLLLADTAVSEAWEIVERLRRRVAAVCIAAGRRRLSVTLSAGLSEHFAGEAPDETLQRADQALLQAKRDGRNRSLTAPPPS
ncbi:biofilm regulation diguanylate cyclase SiaD [Halomonas ramblicola]|uniref:biofilm regulation diguanylate cyclase SiaD n=1 Tax=Halomonas ramblicola TaxID=747349 RepID=UPI0025B2BD41|nr:biofilm regulation diguanylate cyclase SiaD [Halomonas ramblicola]MDN3522523.1 biofilm regulation diguanylate cyclase SiaD [Halomonas ramblicola]